MNDSNLTDARSTAGNSHAAGGYCVNALRVHANRDGEQLMSITPSEAGKIVEYIDNLIASKTVKDVAYRVVDKVEAKPWRETLALDTLLCAAESNVGAQIVELCRYGSRLLALMPEADEAHQVIDAVSKQANTLYG